MRRTNALVALIGIVAALCTVVGTGGTASADPPPPGVNVFVGYADNLRAIPAMFPSPWAGGPNVTFEGCAPTASCTFDGGAVRVVNNTPSPVTVANVAVDVGGCVFKMWSDATLAPGHELIVTQTASGVGDGCPGSSPVTGVSTMDTSDIGPGGAPYAGHCTPDGVIPTVSMNLDGIPNTFTDSGQVLNTKGFDVAGCPSGSNESSQWSPFGPRCPGSTLTLAPPTQNVEVPGPATVAATLVNSCGNPLQNNTVDFTVLSGPNAGLTGSANTDVNGVATFSYASAGTGIDTVHATVPNLAGFIASNVVDVNWLRRPTTLVYNGATTSDFNDPATLSAILTDSATGKPVAGGAIAFNLNGTETCTAATDTAGTATCPVTPQERPGGYNVTASYGGDATYLPSNTSAAFTVTIEETAITSTSSLQLFAAAGSATVSSTLTDPDGGAPIAGKPVTMTLGSGTSAQSCIATTAADGTATCSISPVTVALGPQPVTDAFPGDAFYRPATNTQRALVFAYSDGGSFVIGDQSQAGTVTFWGAQWAKANSLSGGPAPSSFKGFEDTPAVPGCGTAWSTDPGNSTPPPPGPLPSYMAVIVASTVSNSGSTISGNTVHIVIVRTNLGYLADPGHAGTGQVVATLC